MTEADVRREIVEATTQLYAVFGTAGAVDWHAAGAAYERRSQAWQQLLPAVSDPILAQAVDLAALHDKAAADNAGKLD